MRQLKPNGASRIQFEVRFYGLTWQEARSIPRHINDQLIKAKKPEEIERIISEFEAELAALLNPCDDFLICDSATELMADVLRSKEFEFSVVCGINDIGDSHSYIQIGQDRYDPTHQKFGDEYKEDADEPHIPYPIREWNLLGQLQEQQVKHQIDTELKSKIQDFLERELLVTSYIWEKQSNPFDDTTAESVSSHAPSEAGFDSWVETHQIVINDVTLFEEDEDSILVKVDLTAFYSEGNEDDEDNVPEDKWDSSPCTYYVRVQGKSMEIEAMD
ncbi:hypothetical protein [Coleofasciculus sp.]|uniref:hypothetical protein n=1 Tax=Coleofasciculus sp. TaxID=3100458 RepID=UPI0039F82F74